MTPASCPFCLIEEPVVDSFANVETRYATYHQVWCPSCDARGPSVRDSKEKAVELWNERPEKK